MTDGTLGQEFSYDSDQRVLHRTVRIKDTEMTSAMETGTDPTATLSSWWRSWLKGTPIEAVSHTGRTLRTADLFCGPGGLTQGVNLFADEAGMHLSSELAIDIDAPALEVHHRNHLTRVTHNASVEEVLDYRVKHTEQPAFAYPPEIVDPHIAAAAKSVDLLVGGPPCQGHSNLNNHTRGVDPRNRYYLTMPAFAVAADIPAVIIENVPSIMNSPDEVVQTAKSLLESHGYHIDHGILCAHKMGWPQTRKRHFLVATKGYEPIPLKTVQQALVHEPYSVLWALEDQPLSQDEFMHRPPVLDEVTRSRIDWLFDNDRYDLDLKERPPSHRKGTTFTASYGRMYPDRPSPTLTTGHRTPGTGRFVHPTKRRTLTPAEAARIQGFPDTYRFVGKDGQDPKLTSLAKWIGDAVPTPLGYAAAMSAMLPSHSC